MSRALPQFEAHLPTAGLFIKSRPGAHGREHLAAGGGRVRDDLLARVRGAVPRHVELGAALARPEAAELASMAVGSNARGQVPLWPCSRRGWTGGTRQVVAF